MQRPNPLISALHPDDRARLLRGSVLKRVRRHERLHMVGDGPDRVHLLIHGAVMLVARGADGTEALVGLALPGRALGVAAAVDGSTQPWDAIAVQAARAIALDAGLLMEAATRSPAVAIELARCLSREIRETTALIVERTSTDVSARLAGRLLELGRVLGGAAEGSIEFELPFSQGELARLSGMCRESACKTLRMFRANGLLDYKGRKVRLLRPDALSRIRYEGRDAAPSRLAAAGARRRIRSTRES